MLGVPVKGWRLGSLRWKNCSHPGAQELKTSPESMASSHDTPTSHTHTHKKCIGSHVPIKGTILGNEGVTLLGFLGKTRREVSIEIGIARN